jgi:hypothetical protein
LDENDGIDQHKIGFASGLGGNWYSRSSQGLLKCQPYSRIGVDATFFVKQSSVFNGNDLGMLGKCEALPTEEVISIL